MMRNAKKAGMVVFSLVCAMPLVGCYTRTVGARGLGAEWGKTEIYEPNLKESKDGGGLLNGAGDLLFGGMQIEDRRK